MNNSIQVIPFSFLLLAFVPVLVVVGILFKWGLAFRNGLYAVSRMLIQLMLIGYVLTFIFDSDSAWIVLAVMGVMICASSWISLGTIKSNQKRLYIKALFSILLGGGVTLILVTQGVLHLQPWYRPSYFIPLAGMIFANAMNSISLAADRFSSEISRVPHFDQARNIAFKASLIPITNSLLAVGLVSLPGMMTGQILSGISPLVAARYQIMVMCMVYGSAGISSACFLTLIKPDFEKKDINSNLSNMET